MINGTTLKAKRLSAGIPGQVLCSKAGFARSRLTAIERGYFTPPLEELARIETVLDDLIRAKSVIDQVAVSEGWPIPGGR